jgi:hypothetical protein
MILDKDFEIFAMNYSLAQRKDIDDIDIKLIETQWLEYQKYKKLIIERNKKYIKYKSLIKQNVFN